MTGVRTPPRFIAGAVCPRCGARDRVRLAEEAGRRLRDCVACGFHDEIGVATAGDIPGGRHDRPPPARPADGARPLRFYPAKPSPASPARPSAGSSSTAPDAAEALAEGGGRGQEQTPRR